MNDECDQRQVVDSRRQGFRRWRRRRPFWGGSLLVVAALLIGYLPAAYDSFILVSTGRFTTTAILFAVLLLLCGVTVLSFPSVSGLFGFLGMLLSTLALLGALGGFVLGTVIGCLGGLLSFAWKPPDDDDETDSAEPGDTTTPGAMPDGEDPSSNDGPDDSTE